MELQRRAQPWLGTLLEISLRHADAAAGTAALQAGFALVARLQGELSRFEPDSDIARFKALPPGQDMTLRPAAQHVLAVAAWLRSCSGGAFDISQGSGCRGWTLAQGRLRKCAAGTQLDLGGIAKGFVVDRVIAQLRRAGCAWGAVNAGGDLRVFGPQPLPLYLRDERHGGLREIGSLADGAFASSYYGPDSRSRLTGAAPGLDVQVAVAAPSALWADALCKLAALGLEGQSALLDRLRAKAWTWHVDPRTEPCATTTH